MSLPPPQNNFERNKIFQAYFPSLLQAPKRISSCFGSFASLTITMAVEDIGNGLSREPIPVSYGLLGLAFGISDLDSRVSLGGSRPRRRAVRRESATP
jgi:hypothetical protein